MEQFIEEKIFKFNNLLAKGAEQVKDLSPVAEKNKTEEIKAESITNANMINSEEVDASIVESKISVGSATYSFVTDDSIIAARLREITTPEVFDSNGTIVEGGILDKKYFTPQPFCSCGAHSELGAVCPDCNTTVEEASEDMKGAYINLPILNIENNIDLICDIIGLSGYGDEKTEIKTNAKTQLRELQRGELYLILNSISDSRIETTKKNLGENTITGDEAIKLLLSTSTYEDAVNKIEDKIKFFEEEKEKSLGILKEYPDIINKKRYLEKTKKEQYNYYINVCAKIQSQEIPDSLDIIRKNKYQANINKLKGDYDKLLEDIKKILESAEEVRNLNNQIELLEERSIVLSNAHMHGVQPNQLAGNYLYVLPPEFRKILGEIPGKESKEKDRLGAINNSLVEILAQTETIRKLSPASPQNEVEQRKLSKLVQEHREILLDTYNGKDSFVRRKILGFQAVLSGRAVITPNPRLKSNEIGVPTHVAFLMYEDKIKTEMAKRAKQFSDEPFDYDWEISQHSQLTRTILQDVVNKEPWILYSRQPELCQDSLHISKIKLLDNQYNIELNPSMCPSMNADFDGDTIVLFPINGAYNREMEKSKDFQNVSHVNGKILTAPFNESILGLYSATKDRREDFATTKPMVIMEVKTSQLENGEVNIVKYSQPSMTFSIKTIQKCPRNGAAVKTGSVIYQEGENKVIAKNDGFFFSDKESGQGFLVSCTSPIETLQVPSVLKLRDEVKVGKLHLGPMVENQSVDAFSYDDLYRVDENGGIHDNILNLIKKGIILPDQQVFINGEKTHIGRLMLQSALFEKMKDVDNVQIVNNVFFNKDITAFIDLFKNLNSDDKFNDLFIDDDRTMIIGNFINKLQELNNEGLLSDNIVLAFVNYNDSAERLNNSVEDENITDEEYLKVCDDVLESLDTLISAISSNRNMALINVKSYIDNEIPPFSQTLNKSSVKDYLNEYRSRYGNSKLTDFINSFSSLGYDLATILGKGTLYSNSVPVAEESLEDKLKKAGLIDAPDEIKNYYYANTILPEQEKFFKSYMEDNYDTNNFYYSIKSGQKGNINNAILFGGSLGIQKDREGNMTGPLDSNLNLGLSMEDQNFAGASNLAALSKGSEMGTIGGFERVLRSLMSTCYIFEEDCGTTNFIIADKEGTAEEREQWKQLENFCAAEDVKDASGKVIVAKDEVLDYAKIQKIEEAGITKVKRRSPQLCESEVGLCAKCFGADLGNSNIVEVGLSVGTMVAQAITAGISQESMNRAKKTGLDEGPDTLQIISALVDGSNIDVLNAIEKTRILKENRVLSVLNTISEQLTIATGGDVNSKYIEALSASLMSVRVKHKNQTHINTLLTVHEYLHLEKEMKNFEKDFFVEPVFHGVRMGVVLQGEVFRNMAQGGNRMSDALTLATRGREDRKIVINKIKQLDKAQGGRN